MRRMGALFASALALLVTGVSAGTATADSPPKITGPWVTNVTDTSAVFHATIATGGAETSYSLTTETLYCASRTCRTRWYIAQGRKRGAARLVKVDKATGRVPSMGEDGLCPSSTYTVWVTAANALGERESTVTFTTRALPAGKEQPRNCLPPPPPREELDAGDALLAPLAVD